MRKKNKRVYDFIPLKQGLKRGLPGSGKSYILTVYDFIPLKQGLKLNNNENEKNNLKVYDFIPLKQGLKHKRYAIRYILKFQFMTLFH